MKLKLTQNDAQEFIYKLGILADEPDLQEDYSLTKAQADELVALIPLNGGDVTVPAWAVDAVRGEMEDHCEVLCGCASDARGEGLNGQALTISKHARRIEKIIQ